MSKLMVGFAAIVLVGVFCSGRGQSDKPLDYEPEADNSPFTIEFEQGYYDQIEPTVSPAHDPGVDMSYDEAVEMITDPANGELDSYYLVRASCALPLADCEELKGWKSWFESSYALPYEHERFADREWFGDKTIYEVDIIKDLITGEAENRKMYVALSMGNPQEQFEGDPIYSPGEVFSVAVYKADPGSEIIRACGSFMLRYDIEERDGVYFAKSRNNSDLDNLSIDGAKKINISEIRSTTANPAQFSQELPLDSLVEFIKTTGSRGVLCNT